MKWLRWILIAILFLLLAILYIISVSIKPLPSTPTASTADYISRLNFALLKNKYSLNTGISTNTALNNCTFSIISDLQTAPITVILSLKIDPYFQVASLQKIVNQSKMKNKHVVLIDLSLSHPYATLQDN